MVVCTMSTGWRAPYFCAYLGMSTPMTVFLYVCSMQLGKSSLANECNNLGLYQGFTLNEHKIHIDPKQLP